MKKLLLLASVTVLALSSISPARAQIFGPGSIVFDPTAVGRLLEQIGIQGQQLDQLVQTYSEVVQVYNQATNIWNSVSGIIGADQWAPGLNDPTMRNPLPFAAADHPAWVGGFNDPSGLPFGAQYMAQNTVGGDPTVYNDGSFAGGELLKALQSLSSMQAVSTNHVQVIENRVLALNDLFAQLGSMDTLQNTDSLTARLNNELNYANSQQSQATQVMSAAQLQIAALDNNQKQWQYQDETLGITNACSSVAASGGFVSFNACMAAPTVPAGVAAALTAANQ